MGNETEAFTEGAKAVQEAAKTGRALVEAGSDLARFVGKALGTVPEDTVGLLGGDYLHKLRIQNLNKISRKTEEILRERGVEDPEPIGPKTLLPALEAASEETDETLQDMWANLLANAMDPKKDTSLQRVFTEALKQFEPIDALVFAKFLSLERKPSGYAAHKAGQLIGLRSTLVQVSFDRLLKLDILIKTGSKPTGYATTAFGVELNLACTGNAPG